MVTTNQTHMLPGTGIEPGRLGEKRLYQPLRWPEAILNIPSDFMTNALTSYVVGPEIEPGIHGLRNYVGD
ncbi:hypothetical protein DPMN_059177 [Dreissena polymorpha]|uniref:Uncharacterized protein n=1 Tax=Dreissena polymorpha TaxID=45954 RepID=A0A9D4C3H1_DREPO|nr:hypothetical protein DPMN_059177 [Dreissena polymorpha]